MTATTHQTKWTKGPCKQDLSCEPVLPAVVLSSMRYRSEIHDAAYAGDAARVQQLLQERAETMAAAQEEVCIQTSLPAASMADI